ncbi:MAG: bactofilin family protein [Betaproteobacteria bacterium]
MFNKPGVLTRNDPTPLTGRDGRPGPGNANASPPSSSSSSSLPGGKNGAHPISPSSSPAKESSNPTSHESPSAIAPSEHGVEAKLIVGPDVKLRGAEILDCDMLVVEGRVEATMDSRVIRIAEKGSFAGKVSIDIAEIHGVFEGELTARSQLTIHSTGRVKGKIRYGKLIIDEGGELCGEISALSNESPSENRPRIEPVPLSAAG